MSNMDYEVQDPVENGQDESDILEDKDETLMHDLSEEEDFDRGPRGQFINEESDAFVRGDIDVKKQMDRVVDAVDRDIVGYSRSRNEDPRIPNP